jgi:hypothetical protein
MVATTIARVSSVKRRSRLAEWEFVRARLNAFADAQSARDDVDGFAPAAPAYSSPVVTFTGYVECADAALICAARLASVDWLPVDALQWSKESFLLLAKESVTVFSVSERLHTGWF